MSFAMQVALHCAGDNLVLETPGVREAEAGTMLEATTWEEATKT